MGGQIAEFVEHLGGGPGQTVLAELADLTSDPAAAALLGSLGRKCHCRGNQTGDNQYGFHAITPYSLR